MTWRKRAACLNEDPELFFPIGNTGPAFRQIENAKAVCRRCEVVDTCLKWARVRSGGGSLGRTVRRRAAHPQTPKGPRPPALQGRRGYGPTKEILVLNDTGRGPGCPG